MAELVKYLAKIEILGETKRRLHIPSFEVDIDYDVNEQTLEYVKEVAHNVLTRKAFIKREVRGLLPPKSDVPESVPESCIIVTAEVSTDPILTEAMKQADLDEYNHQLAGHNTNPDKVVIDTKLFHEIMSAAYTFYNEREGIDSKTLQSIIDKVKENNPNYELKLV